MTRIAGNRPRQPSMDSVDFSSLPLQTRSPEEYVIQMNLLDEIMDDIGMGKFQKQLFILCGFGWLADNMWLQCIALILPRVQAQFEIPDQYIGILSSSMFIGMMFGALFWGALADSFGRKLAFNCTLIVTTIFGVASSFANSYWLLCLLILCLGFGVGGNMPVDGALFLEFTPKKHQYLLTFLSIFFSFGAVATSFFGYITLPKYSCEAPVEGGCQGRGWRFMLMIMGAVTLSMVVSRVVLFHLEESPKFLLNHNRTDEVAIVLRRIYKLNHKDAISDKFDDNIELLTTRYKQFQAEESYVDRSSSESETSDIESSAGVRSGQNSAEFRMLGDTAGRRISVVHRHSHKWRHKFDEALSHLQPLFSPDFRLSTILIWVIWGSVAFAYTAFNVFYPKFLQEHGESGNQSLKVVYRDILIYSIAGVPGSVLATVLVEGCLGRRYTMAVSTLGTALSTILFAMTSSHVAMTVFSAILSLLSTLNYAVLYSYTPEVFPSDIRGTACGIAAAISRLAGILSPLIVGAMLSISTYFPLYSSSLTFFISGICMCFLPIETRGRVAE